MNNKYILYSIILILPTVVGFTQSLSLIRSIILSVIYVFFISGLAELL